MIQLPANLGQRILDAARIAAAMHQELPLQFNLANNNAGGAGRAVDDHDGLTSMDGTATSPDRRAIRVR